MGFTGLVLCDWPQDQGFNQLPFLYEGPLPAPSPSLHVAGGLRHGQAINNSNNERVCSERNDFMKLRF